MRLRVWRASQSEPSTWNVTTTDSTAALQTAGAIGVNGYLSGSTTALPVVFSFDDLIVSAIDAPPVPSFTSSCVNHTCTFNASASSDSDGTVASYAWDFGDGATSWELDHALGRGRGDAHVILRDLEREDEGRVGQADVGAPALGDDRDRAGTNDERPPPRPVCPSARRQVAARVGRRRRRVVRGQDRGSGTSGSAARERPGDDPAVGGAPHVDAVDDVTARQVDEGDEAARGEGDERPARPGVGAKEFLAREGGRSDGDEGDLLGDEGSSTRSAGR